MPYTYTNTKPVQNMKFTPEQQKENLREAIKDLRENPKKAKGKMRDEDGGRCCLCVMADAAKRITGKEYDQDNALPHVSMGEVFGLGKGGCAVGGLFNMELTVLDECIWMSEHNDGNNCTEKSHKEIADALETQFLQ